jgi:hypothetical protein
MPRAPPDTTARFPSMINGAIGRDEQAVTGENIGNTGDQNS